MQSEAWGGAGKREADRQDRQDRQRQLRQLRQSQTGVAVSWLVAAIIDQISRQREGSGMAIAIGRIWFDDTTAADGHGSLPVMGWDGGCHAMEPRRRGCLAYHVEECDRLRESASVHHPQ